MTMIRVSRVKWDTNGDCNLWIMSKYVYDDELMIVFAGLGAGNTGAISSFRVHTRADWHHFSFVF